MAAETHVKVSTVWNKVKEIHCNVASVWRKCKEVWCNVSGVWQKVYADVTVPAGGIMIWNSTGAVPSGWTAVSSSYNNRYIRGTPSGGTVNSVNGVNSVNLAGTSSADGSHIGTAYTVGCGPGACASTTRAAHSHSVSATFSAYYYYVYFTLISANAETQSIPANVLGLTHLALGTAGGIVDTANVALQNTGYSGYCLLHHATTTNNKATGGTNAPSASMVVNTEAAHNHGTSAGNWCDPGGDSGGSGYTGAVNAGSHNHTGTLTASLQMKAKRLLMFGNTTAAWDARLGMIIMWNTTSIPTGWVLCDGANSTPDMRDYVLMVANAGTDANTVGGGGANTISMSGTLPLTGDHGHGGTGGTGGTTGCRHQNSTGGHTHTISVGATAYTPYVYDLHFIKRLT